MQLGHSKPKSSETLYILFITLKPYHFSLDGITSQNDLLQSKFGSYGEMNNAWTAEDAKGFINIYGNQTKIFQNTVNHD